MVFQEHTYSVLLVSSGDQFTKTIKELMPPTHFYPVHAVRSAGEARRTLLGTGVDIVLINTPLPDEFGAQLAMDLCERSDAAVLLVVKSERYEDVYARVTEHGVLTLPKPTSTQLVRQSLRALCAVRERLRRVGEKQATVEDKIQEIRLVNRAKWALIQCLGMTEQAAHRYIEKRAMDERISRREAAMQVLSVYQPQDTEQ